MKNMIKNSLKNKTLILSSDCRAPTKTVAYPLSTLQAMTCRGARRQHLIMKKLDEIVNKPFFMLIENAWATFRRIQSLTVCRNQFFRYTEKRVIPVSDRIRRVSPKKIYMKTNLVAASATTSQSMTHPLNAPAVIRVSATVNSFFPPKLTFPHRWRYSRHFDLRWNRPAKLYAFQWFRLSDAASLCATLSTMNNRCAAWQVSSPYCLQSNESEKIVWVNKLRSSRVKSELKMQTHTFVPPLPIPFDDWWAQICEFCNSPTAYVAIECREAESLSHHRHRATKRLLFRSVVLSGRFQFDPVALLAPSIHRALNTQFSLSAGMFCLWHVLSTAVIFSLWIWNISASERKR